MPCRVVGATDKVVKGHVEEVSEGDQGWQCGLLGAAFITLVVLFKRTDCGGGLFLGCVFGFAKLFKTLRKIHNYTPKLILAQLKRCVNMEETQRKRCEVESEVRQ